MAEDKRFGDAVQSLRRDKLRDTVVEHLTDMILETELQPGDVLPSQQVLTEKLGVSRAVLREAVQWLEARGLVEAFSGKGVIVSTPDLAPVSAGLRLFLRRHATALVDLWQVRSILEPEVAALAAQAATPEQLEAMAEAVAVMDTSTDASVVADADMRFHQLLAESTDNTILKSITEVYAPQIHDSIETTTAAGLPTYDHSLILEAVRNRDPEAAREAMQWHMASSQKRLRRSSNISEPA